MRPSLPTAIGPYRVVRELGRGGMGVVYEVQDPHAPRTLALKRILPGEADAEALARFKREAELLARVRHPHVVTVHSLGHVDGAPYLVTDLVVGRELKALVRDGPLEPRRAAELTRGLADAVAALHRQGVLHRDLKPENVVVRQDGAPVLLDFGLAREADGAALTRSGSLLGTPAFMAPEQVDGPRGTDERADVYGLGATLFFLLAGRPPYEGSTVQVLSQLATRDPVWPRATRPDVPADLEAIVRAAMAKAPEERTASAVHLRDDLDRWLGGARPLAAVAARARSLRRATLGGLAGVVALAVVVAGVAVLPSPAPPPPASLPPPLPVAPVAPVVTPAPGARLAGRGALNVADARLLEDHRERRDVPGTPARTRPLATLIAPSSTPGWIANAYPRWLDDHSLVVVRDVHEAPEVRLVSLRVDGPATVTRSGLEHGPAAAPPPDDDHVRAAAVVRGARGPAVLLAGDSQTIALVDATTPPGDRLGARWTVPAEWTGAAAALDSISSDPRRTFELYALAAAPDGRTVAAGGDWRRVWLIDLEGTRPDRHLVAAPDEPAHVEGLAFSPDGARLAVVRSHRTIKRPDQPLHPHYIPWRIEVWSVDERPRVVAHHVDPGSPNRARAVAWAAGLLVVGHNTGRLTTWRVGSGVELEPVGEAQVPGEPDEVLGAGLDVNDLVTAPDGRTVYVAGQRRVNAFAPEAGALFWTSQPLERPAVSIDVSPDGALLAVGDDAAGVTLWAAPPPPH